MNAEFLPEWDGGDFSAARASFLGACEDAGVAVTSWSHPLSGPNGEPLATEVARFGSTDARHLLVMVSGVHGVEGYSGSGFQVDWIRRGYASALPEDCAVLLVHAINPWGMAYLRRYTEDNVDLCRNCLDFSELPATRPAYAEVHPQLVLGEELGAKGEKMGPFLGSLVARLGQDALVDGLVGGQYEYSDGFSYGGVGPTWSNTTLRAILAEHAAGVERTCCLEFHSGLGPWAYGSLVSLHTGEAIERVRRFFGDWVVAPQVEESTFHRVQGHTVELYEAAFSECEVTAVTLEFGTYPPDQTLALLLREHLLYQAGDHASELAEVRKEVLRFHHPLEQEWQQAFWSRGLQVLRQAMSLLQRKE